MGTLRGRTREGYLLARNTPPTDGSESSSRNVMKLLLIDPSSRFTQEPPPGLVSPARTTFLVFFLPLVTNSPAKFAASPAISAANSTPPLELMVGLLRPSVNVPVVPGAASPGFTSTLALLVKVPSS